MQLKALLLLAGLATAAALTLPAAMRSALGARSAAAPVATAAPSPGSAEPSSVALHADGNGHFNAEVVIDGRAMRMLVDTGASHCVLSEEDAERLGLRVAPGAFTREVQTANGRVRAAPVRLALVRIGSITVRDVEAVVLPRGRLGQGLLGMSFLRRLRDFSISGGRLTLRG